MNDMNDTNNKNTRERTQAEAASGFTMNKTDIRPVSISSIAMCNMLGNSFINDVLNNVEIDVTKTYEIIEFIWIHCAQPKQVAYLVSNFHEHPDWVTQEVLEFGMNIGLNDFDAYISDITRDASNINNSKTEVLPEKGSKKRKNSQSQDSVNS